MIRGAVAFGLVLRIEPTVENRSVIVTTSLALVVTTTVFLGSTVATVQKCLFGREMAAAEKAAQEGKPHLGHDESHHEIVEHPNLEDVNAATPVSKPSATGEKKKQGCATILRRLDIMIIKPLLIYKYEHDTHKKQKIFNELLMLEGDKLEEIFAHKEGQGETRKSQLLEYLNNKGGRLSNNEKSEQLDSEKSGQIELQTQKLSPNVKKGVLGQEQPYKSLYDNENANHPLLDNK